VGCPANFVGNNISGTANFSWCIARDICQGRDTSSGLQGYHYIVSSGADPRNNTCVAVNDSFNGCGDMIGDDATTGGSAHRCIANDTCKTSTNNYYHDV